MAKKSVISQLQAAGENALGKLAQNTTTRSALRAATQLKDRGERIVQGLESIEGRLAAIEKRLAALEAQSPPRRTRARNAAAKASTTGGSSTKSTRAAKPRSSTKA
jgi:hypothetical protein